MDQKLKPPVFTLIDNIKYKLSLDKEIKAYKDIIKRLEADRFILDTEIMTLNSYNQDKIAEIINKTDPAISYNLNLIAREIKVNWFKRFLNRVFKFDGYILYINKANELKLFKVKNFKQIYNLNDLETYGLNDAIGTFNGKPIFMVKYPNPITLDIKGTSLSYDAMIFYNMVNKVTKQNLTNWGSNLGLGDFIKKYFIYIIIAIGLILLFTTPQGQEFLSKIIPSTKPA